MRGLPVAVLELELSDSDRFDNLDHFRQPLFEGSECLRAAVKDEVMRLRGASISHIRARRSEKALRLQYCEHCFDTLTAFFWQCLLAGGCSQQPRHLLEVEGVFVRGTN